jgi:hypothetical protein
LGFNLRIAARGFNISYVEGPFVPKNANIWVMPGDYQNAQGKYDKPIIIRAPFGNVTLR